MRGGAGFDIASAVAIAGAALHGLFARANRVSAEEEREAQEMVDGHDHDEGDAR